MYQLYIIGIIISLFRENLVFETTKGQLWEFEASKDWCLIVFSLILLNTLLNYYCFYAYAYTTKHESRVMRIFFYSLGINAVHKWYVN